MSAFADAPSSDHVLVGQVQWVWWSSALGLEVRRQIAGTDRISANQNRGLVS
jgi:hypothetical protein